MNMVIFTVPGNPVAWQRAGSNGNRRFTQDKASGGKNACGFYAGQAMQGRPLLDGQLDIEILAYREIPASWSAKKKAEALCGLIRPTSKPDFDNLAKLVADAINTIVYVDDARIVDATIRKFYSDKPRTEVTVKPASLSMPSFQTVPPGHDLALNAG